MIYHRFALSARELATYEDTGIPFDISPVAKAAVACARAEDALIFHGAPGVDGLLTVDGAKEVTLSAWDEVGVAAGDVITAMTTLDEAGFHGPYTLALAPERYNLLYRLYQRGNKTEMDHVRAIATDGVYKAPILDSGGVLIATGRQYNSIILGQDMTVGFIGPVGYELELSVSESLALRIRRPEAICVLRS
jgi:uncharacterized linocin/CFP29 family protein